MLIVELLGPNFQQKFAFWGRSMKFGVDILLTMLYLKIDRRKGVDLCMTLMGRDLFRYLGHASVYLNKWLIHNELPSVYQVPRSAVFSVVHVVLFNNFLEISVAKRRSALGMYLVDYIRFS